VKSPSPQSYDTDTLNNSASDALLVSESRYRRLFETAQDGILLLNADTAQIEDVNPFLIKMLGYSHTECLGKKLWEVGPFADIAQSKEMFVELQAKGYARYDDLPLKTKAGTKIQVEFVSNSYECGGIKVIQCNIRDITERKVADAKIQRHIHLYAALSQCNKAIVYSANEEELFLQVCRAAVQFGGMNTAIIGLIDRETLRVLPVASFGNGTLDLKDFKISASANNRYGRGPIGTAIRENRPFWCQDFMNDPITIPWQKRGKKAGWGASASLPLHQKNVVIGAFVLYSDEVNAFDEAACNLLIEMATDISFALDNFARESQRKLAANEIEHLAFYDPLTSLPNRRLLHDRLQQALTASARHNNHGAVLFIDLDNFKTLNDTMGHNIGDLLLVEAASRLQNCAREGDTVSRLGGDEFVVILEELSDIPSQAAIQAEAVGNKILSSIRLPFSLQGYEYHCSTSIGISLFRNHETTEGDLLQRTDTAMYQAKNAGRNTLRFYDPAMQAALGVRTALGNDLRSAVADNQLRLYYQMQVNQSGHILGAEVLIRWQHPLRGLVSPVEFIPLAEEMGLIVPIGLWVLETACTQLKSWEPDPLARHLVLAVNVSARQFYQPDFVEQVIALLRKFAIDPSRLKFELTETIVMDDIEDTIAKMHTLKQYGVHFSMDDFGTGYSSLSSLTQLPLDQLKIDQSFVRNIGVKHTDAVIVQTIIGMAHNLEMEVIAEGVETEEQRAFLEQHGCQLYQGYLFSKPVPIGEFEALLK